MLQLILNLTFSASITESELDKIIEKLVNGTRKENGCIRYEAFKSFENTHSILFVEHWQSEKALNDHKSSVSVEEFRTSAGHLVTDKQMLSSSVLEN